MILKYLPLLIASFAVVAEDEPNLVTNDFYNVTISVSDEGQLTQKTTQQLPVNSKSAFAATATKLYVKGFTKEYKWYHTLLGIEPNPVARHGEYKTGFEGFVTVNKVSEQEVSVEIQSIFSELIKIEKYGIIEGPTLSAKHYSNKETVNFKKNNGCLQINTNVEICISKA